MGTAEKALKSLESGSFDVLLTDVRLPGISGIALAKEAVSRWPRMGVLISSGYGDALSLDYFPAELKDVVALVPKPCDLATLPQALADASRARSGTLLRVVRAASATSEVCLTGAGASVPFVGRGRPQHRHPLRTAGCIH